MSRENIRDIGCQCGQGTLFPVYYHEIEGKKSRHRIPGLFWCPACKSIAKVEVIPKNVKIEFKQI